MTDERTETPWMTSEQAAGYLSVSKGKPASEVTEDAEPTSHEAVDAAEQELSVDEKIRNAKVTGSERMGTIGELVHELLTDVDLTYLEIVALVKEKFPDAKTTARSVASVAAVLRKKGTLVPIRRKAKAP